jgi:hypothetical protein
MDKWIGVVPPRLDRSILVTGAAGQLGAMAHLTLGQDLRMLSGMPS